MSLFPGPNALLDPKIISVLFIISFIVIINIELAFILYLIFLDFILDLV